MKFTYCLSAYGSNAYVYSIPLKASAKWLSKTLDRTDIINGEPLSKDQFEKLRLKVNRGIEVCWYQRFQHFVEGTEK